MTCETEYISAIFALKEIIWLCCITMNTTRNETTRTVQLHVDSQSVIDTACNKGNTKRCKHIDVHYHHLAHYIHDGTAVLQHAPSYHNLADGLTKNLKPAPTNSYTESEADKPPSHQYLGARNAVREHSSTGARLPQGAVCLSL